MMRICKECNEQKEIDKFVKGNKEKFRYICKVCYNKTRRKGLPNLGRFVKGQKSLNPYKKGHVPWSKLNKGTYSLGRTSNNRNSLNYLDWVKNVKNRDQNKCRECGSMNYLEAHHIYNYEDYPEKRCEINNGVTLCRSCHKKVECFLKKFKNCIITWDKY